uniref:Tick transposon n=1 Tax=Rhipicephalus zambeziensis TaxID=60191 RepID=A0A224ZAF4_9ACAR
MLQTWLNDPNVGNHRLHKLDPSRKLQVPSDLSRRDATLLCRLWLGVAFTKAYSLRIGMADTSKCDSCDSDETIEHLLCSCDRLVSERNVLRDTLNKLDDRSFSEEKILGSWLYASQASIATRALMHFFKIDLVK